MDISNIKSCFICKKFKVCYPWAKYKYIEKYTLAGEEDFKTCDKFELIDKEFIEKSSFNKD